MMATRLNLASPALSKKRIPLLSWLWRFFTHPTTIFVLLQLICVAITVIWVVWFVDQNHALEEIRSTLGKHNISTKYGLTLLIVGCVLLGMLIVGTIMLFVFAQRQAYFLAQQRSFVSSVTHELRSPLASLQLSFQTLTSRELPAPVVSKMYGMVGRDIQRLSRLVEQILISARLDKGLNVDEGVEVFDLVSLIRQVIVELRHLDPNLEHRIKLEAEKTAYVESIRSSVELIATNLIENAVKYSPKESPITVTISKHERHLLFSVADKGFGLSSKEARRVFRMFHRARVATKKAIPGTGLGLFIVKSMLTNLGGKVWVDSKGVGEGSTFYVVLPIKPDSVND